MAKRKTPILKSETPEILIDRLMLEAVDQTIGQPIFANHVQITRGKEEIIIDFYRAGPVRGKTGHLEMAYVQRIIMPPTAALGMAEVFERLMMQSQPDQGSEETQE